MKVGRIVGADAGVKGRAWEGLVTLGEESAALLGVPVGSQVDLGIVARSQRFPKVGLLATAEGRRIFRVEYRLWRDRNKVSGGFDPSRGIPADARLILPT